MFSDSHLSHFTKVRYFISILLSNKRPQLASDFLQIVNLVLYRCIGKSKIFKGFIRFNAYRPDDVFPHDAGVRMPEWVVMAKT